jgi:hypothetical protein
VGLVVQEMALLQAFITVLWLSLLIIILSLLHIHITPPHGVVIALNKQLY